MVEINMKLSITDEITDDDVAYIANHGVARFLENRLEVNHQNLTVESIKYDS